MSIWTESIIAHFHQKLLSSCLKICFMFYCMFYFTCVRSFTVKCKVVVAVVLKILKCMLNHDREWAEWVLTNLSHFIDRGLTHLFLGRTSHAWLHASGVTTRVAALRLYHCRCNVRDRDYECDHGITRKLCYRKDDHAMRDMDALKIFGSP